jgi:hypothetical protein
MGLLIILIEIFSVSVIGLILFFCMLGLFVQRWINYKRLFSWFIVLMVQFTCIVFIMANFIATTSLISENHSSPTDIFRFYGINGFINFTTIAREGGYVICLFLLFFVTCFMQRIFCDIKIYELAKINLSKV